MIYRVKKTACLIIFGSSLWLCFSCHLLSGTFMRVQATDRSNLIEQVQIYYARGQFQQAIALLENILATPAGREQPELHCYLAASYREIGQLSKAIRAWKLAVQIYREGEKSKLETQLAATLVDLGQAYNGLGQFRRAIPLLEEAIELAKKTQAPKIEAIAWDVFGTSYLLSGNYDRAIESYGTSLEQSRQLNQVEEITAALNNLSNAFSQRQAQYLTQAEFARLEEDEEEAHRRQNLAAKDHQSALKAASEAVEVSHHLITLSAVRARLHLRSLSPSEDNLAELVKILQQLPDSRLKAYELINLAAQMDGKETRQTLEWAIAVAQTLGDFRTESFALGALGELYERSEEYDLALKFTYQAQVAAQQVSAQDSLYRWQWQAGRIYRATGKPAEAKVAYRQAVASLQRIRGDIAIASQKFQLDFRAQIEPVYRELLEVLLASGSPQELKETLQVFEALQLSELQNFFGDDCLEIIEAVREPETWLTRTNTAVIHTIVLPTKTYVILHLPNNQLQLYPVNISQPKLEKLLLEWRFALEDISSYRYLDLSRQLYDLLIRDLVSELNQVQPKAIVFINDGLLRNVPMAALHDGKQFLLEKYPLAVSLGLNFAPSIQPSENLQPLIFGLGVAIPPFNALPNIARETEEIQTILGGKRFLNQDFTWHNLREQIINENYPVVHLATHGRFGGNAESTFLQAFERQISLTDLENLLSNRQKPLELLTLSACQTAAGNNRSTLGLAGVALRSGVKSTLGTLWFVDDAATVDLMTDFYQYLNQGLSKAEALRQAQLNQITAPGSHASIWSSFVLIGNWL